MKKKRILIVDDEASFTRMVRINLEKTGLYEVKEENVARRAAQSAREFKPDLVLLDVVMPGMDGGDVAAEIRSDLFMKTVPMVFLTAVVSKTEAPQGAVVSGGGVFLAKPVSLQTLVECIERNLPGSTEQGQKPGPQPAP